jgi:RNA polymerase sigma-70 factor (ECF subfamily)
MFDTNIPDTTKRTLPLPDETDLLSRVALGNHRAFEIIYHHYRPKIYSYAYQLFGAVQMADELVQEVFLKVWLNRDKLPHILKFDAWLFILARNQVFDMLKLLAKETTARQQMARLLDPEANFVEDQLLDKENELRLRHALDHLSPQQKLIFTLSRHQGMKHDEIASRLNISRNTVKTHLVHALKTLRDILHFHSDSVLLLVLSLCSFC